MKERKKNSQKFTKKQHRLLNTREAIEETKSMKGQRQKFENENIEIIKHLKKRKTMSTLEQAGFHPGNYLSKKIRDQKTYQITP